VVNRHAHDRTRAAVRIRRGRSEEARSPGVLAGLGARADVFLAVGGALIVGGPLRAAWSRPERSARSGLIGWLPTLLSLTLTLSLLMFFTDYASPFTRPWLVGSRLHFTPEPTHGQVLGGSQGEREQGAGATGILLYAGLLTGLVLFAIRRWELPAGSLTLLFTLAIGLSLVPHGQFRFIPVALAGGIAGDILHSLLRPGVERRGALRVFAFAVRRSCSPSTSRRWR
jgi:hypothetical protein